MEPTHVETMGATMATPLFDLTDADADAMVRAALQAQVAEALSGIIDVAEVSAMTNADRLRLVHAHAIFILVGQAAENAGDEARVRESARAVQRIYASPQGAADDIAGVSRELLAVLEIVLGFDPLSGGMDS